MEDEIITRWQESGLLDGLTNEQKVILAPLYDSMAKHIISLNIINKDYGQRNIETVIFPIMYRVIKKGGTIQEITTLYQNVVDFFNENENIEVESFYNVDVEVELCALFVENYLEKNIKPITPNKFIIRHKL